MFCCYLFQNYSNLFLLGNLTLLLVITFTSSITMFLTQGRLEVKQGSFMMVYVRSLLASTNTARIMLWRVKEMLVTLASSCTARIILWRVEEMLAITILGN